VTGNYEEQQRVTIKSIDNGALDPTMAR